MTCVRILHSDVFTGRWADNHMIPVVGKQYLVESSKKSFQGNSKKTLNKKSKQSNDGSHSNNIARTIFHIFGMLSSVVSFELSRICAFTRSNS